jgi:hypothetical protein
VFIWCDDMTTSLGDFLYVTDVQLEVGSLATPFERKLMNQTFNDCLRYYWRMTGAQGSFTGFLNGSATGGTAPAVRRNIANNPVPMRAAPSHSFAGTVQYGNGTGTYFNITALGFDSSSTFMTSLDVAGGTAITGGVACHVLFSTTSASDWFEAVAEL